MQNRLKIGIWLATFILFWGGTIFAQFRNRYPKVQGYGHHIYLEGYELPVLGTGPIDPAVSPDGHSLVFSSRGWLWLLNLTSEEARRITGGSDIDSRPNWSQDGRWIVFVRDNSQDTSIVLLNLETHHQEVLIDTPAIDLDPVFSYDSRFVYYSSAEAGNLDLWRIDLSTKERERLTDDTGLELKPLILPGGKHIIYLSKRRGGQDRICLLNTESGERKILKTEGIVSQLRPTLHPGGRSLVVNWPGQMGWQLWLVDIKDPEIMIPLTRKSNLPLTPAWNPDGQTVFFVEADRYQRFNLKRISSFGGETETIPIRVWDWGVPTTHLLVKTRLANENGFIPARLHISDQEGHPLIGETGQARFDSQSGQVYVYSPGTLELEVPLGKIKITATHGLSTPAASAVFEVTDSTTNTVEIELKRVWNPRENGWYSGDHHFHLNYGGPFSLEPEDLIPIMQAEDLDVGTPLLANLYNRLKDIEWWDWQRLGALPFIKFGQEIRPDFLGHLGLIGIDTLFWPWYWGPVPGYPLYNRDDRPNEDALKHAHKQGGLNAYVHPVRVKEPFNEDSLSSIPLSLIPDAVLGDLDALEIACLWSDEIGTSEVWYRLLNLGIPIIPSAGTDAFPNFYRCMALGTTRIYVHPKGVFNWKNYLSALREGRSFVTNGPLLDFQVEGLEPGNVLKRGSKEVPWSLALYSAIPLEKVEVLVNGQVKWSGEGINEFGSKSFSGVISIPEGDWIAARAYGGLTRWPSMDSYPFAHTAPVWIKKVGSIQKEAEQEAVRDLLAALAVAERRLDEGYSGIPIPRLKSRFQKARRYLEMRQAD